MKIKTERNDNELVKPYHLQQTTDWQSIHKFEENIFEKKNEEKSISIKYKGLIEPPKQ